jgi:hypothetical protein
MRSASPIAFHSAATTAHGNDAELRALETRVSAEFHDMPGLVLTGAQASRLFGLEPTRCEHVLAALVARGVLASNGRTYARADAGARCA